MENITEMLKGVLEGCVLEIIGREETYGYEITRRLNELGFSDVVEGTVYTILLRLERNKLVSTRKKASSLGPPRKFYTLNAAGHEELQRFWKKWEFVATKIGELKSDLKKSPRSSQSKSEDGSQGEAKRGSQRAETE